MANIGRNAPCPCGSGKKYKKCCLPGALQQIGKEESIEKKLVDNLIQFIGKHCRHLIDDARSVFWDEFDPKEHLDQDGLDLAEMTFLGVAHL
jgi:SEC-C motif